MSDPDLIRYRELVVFLHWQGVGARASAGRGLVATSWNRAGVRVWNRAEYPSGGRNEAGWHQIRTGPPFFEAQMRDREHRRGEVVALKLGERR